MQSIYSCNIIYNTHNNNYTLISIRLVQCTVLLLVFYVCVCWLGCLDMWEEFASHDL